MEKCPLKTVKKVIKMLKNLKKKAQPITSQCLTRIYRYVRAHMIHYIKNESNIKTLKILLV